MRKKNTDTDTYSYRGWLVSDKFLKRRTSIKMKSKILCKNMDPIFTNL